jgi:hypothetical protein
MWRAAEMHPDGHKTAKEQSGTSVRRASIVSENRTHRVIGTTMARNRMHAFKRKRRVERSSLDLG